MLAEAAGIRKIILAVGYTDLRKGVDSLAQLVGTRYDLNPFEKEVYIFDVSVSLQMCLVHRQNDGRQNP